MSEEILFNNAAASKPLSSICTLFIRERFESCFRGFKIVSHFWLSTPIFGCFERQTWQQYCNVSHLLLFLCRTFEKEAPQTLATYRSGGDTAATSGACKVTGIITYLQLQVIIEQTNKHNRQALQRVWASNVALTAALNLTISLP